MISRRTFLGAVGTAFPACRKHGFTGSFGLQTYSLRYDAEEDLPATLALIRSLGFEEVEVSGFHGRSAEEYRRLLDDAGLKATSMMADYDRLDQEVGLVAEDAHQLTADYVVCSTLPQQTYMTGEECRQGAEFLNRSGEALASSGLRCCYHTHGTEFRSSPGRHGL